MITINEILSKHTNLKKNIDNEIKKITRSNYPIINTAISDLISGGGKRLRPFMVILSSEFGRPSPKLIKLAAGIEILHMATLIHDDIIDEAQNRRGSTAAQKKFGKNIAVFTGDFLLSKVFDLFVKHSQKKTIYKLSKIVKIICEGEITQFENKFNTDITLKDYFHRVRRKTALLFGYSTYLGAYEAGLRNKNLYNLYNTGLNFGMAFQIQDDLLDFKGKEKIMGKEVGQDIKSGIYTLPVIILLQNENNKIKKILNKDNLTSQDLKFIYYKINHENIIIKSRKIMNKFLSKANQHLQQFPKSNARKELKDIIFSQYYRRY
ncbi:MAG: polyprenyl synthetase family protein [Halanaerobiales bacterium]